MSRLTTSALVVLLLTTLSRDGVDGANRLPGYKLHNDLFLTQGYNKDVHPTRTGYSLLVYITFSLVSLVEVDEKNQRLTTNARLQLEWKDKILSWVPEKYEGISTLFTTQEKIWLPDITVANSVTSQEQIGFSDLPVRIQSDGRVVWSPTVIVSTSCDIIVTYYPFDTQMCFIDYETIISTWMEVDINIDLTQPIDISNYSPDGSWELIDHHARNLDNDNAKTKIRFMLLLKRRTTFYVINLILPVLFLSLTAALVFALPADSGEKMGTGITVLLSYAVYLTIVSAYLPNTSLQTSLLALYLAILLGYTAFSVVVTAFILRLYHKSNEKVVGPRVTRFIIFLQKVTFYNRNYRCDKEEQQKGNTVFPISEDCRHDAQSDDGFHPQSEPPNYEEPMTWIDVAKTLDRFCFSLFSFLILATTLVVMVVLVVGGNLNAPTLDKMLYEMYNNTVSGTVQGVFNDTME